MTRRERSRASRDAEQRLERWRDDVERLLREQFSLPGRDDTRLVSVDYVAASSTVVGIFDAGARAAVSFRPE